MEVSGLNIDIRLLVVVGAFLLDLVIGEPPELIHPVVWIGKLIESFRDHIDSEHLSRFHGGILFLVVVGGTSAGVYFGVRSALGFSRILGCILSAYLLKSTISMRGLVETVKRVGQKVDNDPGGARSDLIALVGRDRMSLSPVEMRSAAIESLFENLVDSYISPLFYFLIGGIFSLSIGVAAGVFFKAVNTVDSMVGYRTEDLVDLGYAGAKVDDWLNWFPARVSPFLIAISGFSFRGVTLAFRDWRKTPSPNSGWSMAAGSGVLGVKLIKKGVYSLGEEYGLPVADDMKKAIVVSVRVMVIFAGLVCGMLVFM